ncbi:MAG: hypothetical protein U0441_38130 [Polyangiaceae bacterium]
MASVPLGLKVDARHVDRLSRRFRCARCAFDVDVVVFGAGTGRGISPLFLDNEEAAGRAEIRASRNAAKEASENLQLFPCPRCGHRDATAFVIKSAARLVAIGGLFCGLAVLSAHARDASIAALFWPASVLGPLLFYYARIRPKWLGAGKHVLMLADYRSRIADENDDRELEDNSHEDEGTPSERNSEVPSPPERDRGARQAQAYLAMSAPSIAIHPTTAILILVMLAVVVFALVR